MLRASLASRSISFHMPQVIAGHLRSENHSGHSTREVSCVLELIRASLSIALISVK